EPSHQLMLDGCAVIAVPSLLSWRVAEGVRTQAAQLAIDVGAFVEGEPASYSPGLTRQAVGDLRVGLQARAGRIAPPPGARRPARDDPAPAGLVTAGGKGLGKDLVVVRALVAPPPSLEHHARLHLKARQLLVRAVGNPQLHSHTVSPGHDFQSKRHLVRQSSLDFQ